MSHRFFDRPFEDRLWPRGLGGRHGLGGRRGWTGVRLLLALLWALALVPLASSTVHAQPQLDSVRDILERTDRVLERAREQVSASVSSRPGMLLGQAIELQRRAWESFRAGSPNSRKAALSLTQQA
ncbi:MAG: hypothetical protein QUU85_13855, partial [Candidatus Eisenbacteria bacterium]|nr:hypothetical protein [Candidatus Eisenbacteria bacterium]